jgi:hypothetical protein
MLEHAIETGRGGCYLQLTPGSEELLLLNRQISDVEDVVLSYRLVRRAAGAR